LSRSKQKTIHSSLLSTNIVDKMMMIIIVILIIITIMIIIIILSFNIQSEPPQKVYK